jgi:hypothetical protein
MGTVIIHTVTMTTSRLVDHGSDEGALGGSDVGRLFGSEVEGTTNVGLMVGFKVPISFMPGIVIVNST